MHRRALLAGLSTALTASLAGCGGDGNGDGDGGGEESGTPESESGTPTPAETETPTETATPADAETPTETPTPASADGETSFTHDVGETFTVGEEGKQVTYRIIELTRADQIGSEVNFSEADGTYLIVTLEVTNPRSEAVEFPRLNFRLLTDDGAWQRFDREPSQKVNSDDRIDVEHIGDATIEPGTSALGTVVFDVDPEKSQRLWITPTGEAEMPEHFVPVGDLSEIEELGGY
ncbi:MAG: hypothetical protein BRD23_03775 [Halobacteriales archaeon SW_9_67_25]|jgi:hypothetical protein|nr:MAG: hypothetical protein BRD23_03775 [Halobacteriales archaeon SW_9_67_25]